jgi:hypothetical protein
MVMLAIWRILATDSGSRSPETIYQLFKINVAKNEGWNSPNFLCCPTKLKSPTANLAIMKKLILILKYWILQKKSSFLELSFNIEGVTERYIG